MGETNELERKLSELRAKYGEIHELSGGGVRIYVRNPTDAEFDRCQAAAGDGKSTRSAYAQLIRDVLVHPSHDEWAGTIATRPGLPIAFGNAIIKLTGALLEVEAKKA